METVPGISAPAEIMLRNQLYLDGKDQRKHLNQIRSLAHDLQRPIQEIVPLYENLLEELRRYARIPDFLPVIVSKKVRECCRKSS